MASITRIDSIRGVSYRITVSLGYDKTGKKLKKNVNFKPDQNISVRQQEKEAEKFAYEFEEKLKNGVSYDGNKISFEDFSTMWLDYIETEVTYNTYKSYNGMLQNKIVPYFRNHKIAKIKLPLIESFYMSLAGHYSQASIKRCDIILNGIFKWAYRYDMISKNPCTGALIPKTKKKSNDLEYFTPPQSLKFLESLDMDFELMVKGHQRVDDTGKFYYVNDYGRQRGVPTQFKVFFNIALFCGMRKGEILALQWDDVNLREKTIQVTKSVAKTKNGVDFKEPKTKASVRTVAIPDQLLPLLTKYQTEYNIYKISLGDKWAGEGNVFIQADGKLMGVSTPYQRFISHIKRYNEWVQVMNNKQPIGEQNYEPLPVIPLHGLRHSCATLLNYLDVNIIDIAKILGHAQTSTTMNIYAHSFEAQSRVASNRIDEFLRQNA